MHHTGSTPRWLISNLVPALLAACTTGGSSSSPPPIVPGEHPRLFFGDADIAVMKQQAETTHAEIWAPIEEMATRLLSDALPVEPTSAGLQQYYDFADNLTVLAFASLMDEQYLAKARDTALAYASWTYWGDEQQLGGRDLGLAAMIRANAVAYDWLYDRLTESDRSTIRGALGKHTDEEYVAAITVANNPDWNNWWSKSYIQNHWSTNNSSIGIAALVLDGEDSRSADWLSQAITEMERDTTILEQIVDGTWHEGINYQNWKFEAPMQFYLALHRGKAQDIVPHNYLNQVATWRLYNYLPGQVLYSRAFPGCVMPIADYVHAWGGVDIGGGNELLEFIASQERNTTAQWVAQSIRADYGLRSYWRAKEYVFEFMYYDPTLEAAAPSPPLSRTFADLEGVIWRTGWGTDDLVFGFKTGANGGRYVFNQYLSKQPPLENNGYANVGHDHRDANSFNIFRGSVELTSEMPAKETGQTEYHNSLLVDGNGQFITEWGRVYAETDGKLLSVLEVPDFDYLAADATNCYRPRDETDDTPGAKWLTEFTRHVLFVRPGYFVVVDNIRSDTPHRYDWISYLAEAKPAPVTVDGTWVKGPAANSDVLGIKVLAPAGFAYEIGEGTYPYSGTPPKTKPRIVIRPSSDVNNTRFITVFYPTTDSLWSSRPTITLLGESNDGAALRMDLEGKQEHVFRYGAGGSVAIGEFELTGRVASVARNTGGDIQRVFLGDGTRLVQGGQLLMSSQAAAIVEAVYSGNTLALSGSAVPAGLSVYGPAVSADKVTVNGSTAAAVKDGVYVVIQ